MSPFVTQRLVRNTLTLLNETIACVHYSRESLQSSFHIGMHLYNLFRLRSYL